jgi:hypothetical protein
MIRPVLAGMALIAGLLSPVSVARGAAASAAQAPAQVTPADAAPFIGQWTLALEGPNGPGTFELTVKVEQEKVVGEITSEAVGAQPITDVTRADKSLLLRYAFDYEGNRVDAVVWLTPVADGKTTAKIDFAGGAYLMSGTATKKEKAK